MSAPEGTSSGSDGRVSDSKPLLATKRHAEFFFDNTLVAIQIEDTLFNVHKYQLLKSEIFSDMFKIPKKANEEPEEGSSPENPIMMQGVTVPDFVALLRVLYASHFSSNQPAPEASLIIPAFRLANMWNFSDLRTHLLPLAEKELSDIDKILFAREFRIKEWLVPAHVNLCTRPEPLTSDEATKLGVQSVLLIFRMREQMRLKAPKQGAGYYCARCSGGYTYTGNRSYCAGCSTSNVHVYYNGTPSQNSDQLKELVEKWVEDGCVLMGELVIN